MDILYYELTREPHVFSFSSEFLDPKSAPELIRLRLSVCLSLMTPSLFLSCRTEEKQGQRCSLPPLHISPPLSPSLALPTFHLFTLFISLTPQTHLPPPLPPPPPPSPPPLSPPHLIKNCSV